MAKKSVIALHMLLLLILPLDAFSQGIEIREVRVSVDYDEAYTYRLERKDRLGSESNIANGSTIAAEILPGSNVTFTFWIENTFSGGGIEINNILPRITIEELDDGADVDFDADEIDLEAGEEQRIDVKFFMPLDADAITYDVIIEAEGEENGTSYGAEFAMKMPIRKQSHDIRIINAYVNPAVIECGRKATISAEIANMGSNEESDVSIELKSTILGISEREDGIFLESSQEASIDEKSYAKDFKFEIPEFTTPGTYPVFVNLYWKQLALFDQEKVFVTIRNCMLPQNLTNSTTNGTSSISESTGKGIVVQRGINGIIIAAAFGGAILVLALLAAILILHQKKRKK